MTCVETLKKKSSKKQEKPDWLIFTPKGQFEPTSDRKKGRRLGQEDTGLNAQFKKGGTSKLNK